MAGESWNIPQKGYDRVGAPSTNWLIETAMQAWERQELFDPDSINKQLDSLNKKVHKKTTQQKQKQKKQY